MSLNSIFFSVVIPAYNAATFIADTLDSIRIQTFENYEVLVTNDGSTDATEQVVNSYVKEFPTFPLRLASQNNKGIGAARNNGVFRARGEFIAFLDADDKWSADKLETVFTFLKAYPECDVVYHQQVEVSREGERTLEFTDMPENALETLLFVGNRLATSATVVRRTLAQQLGGFSTNMAFNSSEDYEFWIRLAKAGGRFRRVPKVLGQYNKAEGGISSRIEYHYKNIENVLEFHFAELRRAGNDSSEALEKKIAKRRASLHYSKGWAYWQAGEFDLSCEALLVSIRKNPLRLKSYLLFVIAKARVVTSRT